MPSIYIVNPKAKHTGWGDPDALQTNGRGWVMSADLTIATVAALVPPDWTLKLVDEQIEPVNFDVEADFVAITGKTTQRARIIELAHEFKRRGRTVLIGGPLASLDPELLRPHADILVVGELEELAPKLFADLASGSWSNFYDGGRADMRFSPLPRWDLYPVHAAEMGALQTTRGCPFDCEFCDVITYQGRKQRHKSVDHVLAELDLLYQYGFRYIFLVDDNFTVHRSFARSMLQAFIDWNAGHANDPVRFATQGSLDLARDSELMSLCAAAGLRMLFVGVETNNEASLRETGKRQNLLLPVADAVARIVRAGIAIRAGIVVGFDQDGLESFDTLFEFVQASPLPDLTINALTASKGTRLYTRMVAEKRLVEGMWNTSFETNIVPKQMTRAALSTGVRRLSERVYEPRAFETRMMNLIEMLGGDESGLTRKAGTLNDRTKMMLGTLRKISERGRDEAKMVSNLLAAAAQKPVTLPTVLAFLTNYEKARHFLDQETEVKALAS
jgi:radical SAM superfamily enzyme YgiQ (UPF0313 family)